MEAKKIFQSAWTYAIIVFLILGGIYGYKNITGKVISPGQHDDFAKYLTEQGVKMYGTEWCPHCKNQKALFGDSFQYIDYVDCDKEAQLCLKADIRGYPTWIINGEKYPGEQSLEKLAQLTNYDGEI